jgi:UrcA family protein
MGSLSAISAAGESSDNVRTRVVKFTDLDLTRSAGVAVLYTRIKQAARDVCAPFNSRALGSIADARSCTEHSIARAVADVNAPALTSYHLTNTGQTIIVAQRR